MNPTPAVDSLLGITGYHSFTIPAGVSDLDIAVNPLTDGIVEGAENVRLQLVSDNVQYKTGSSAKSVGELWFG
jgi:hypothetical protein